MTRGRRPKPALLKAMEGNRGHRKVSPGLELPAGPFEPPFPLDGIALQEWERIVAEAFWLRETDASALADRCLCFQRLREAEEDIRKNGMATGKRGRRTANPSVRFSRQYRQAIQRYDEQLGLTASTRERLGASGPLRPNAGEDPIEAALCWSDGEQAEWLRICQAHRWTAQGTDGLSDAEWIEFDSMRNELSTWREKGKKNGN